MERTHCRPVALSPCRPATGHPTSSGDHAAPSESRHLQADIPGTAGSAPGSVQNSKYRYCPFFFSLPGTSHPYASCDRGHTGQALIGTTLEGTRALSSNPGGTCVSHAAQVSHRELLSQDCSGGSSRVVLTNGSLRTRRLWSAGESGTAYVLRRWGVPWGAMRCCVPLPSGARGLGWRARSTCVPPAAGHRHGPARLNHPRVPEEKK